MRKYFKSFLPIFLKFHWKSLIAGFLTITIPFGTSHYFFSNANKLPTYTEHTVQIGNLLESIKTSGKAELADEQKLRFNLTGKVTGVYFSDGDEIKKDQVIAELDKNQLEGDIRQAEINLQNAHINLNKLLKGSTAAEIIRAKSNVSDTKAKIDITEKNLLIAKNDYEVELRNLNLELELAENDVTEKKKSLDLAKKIFENAGIYKADDDIGAVISYNAELIGTLADIHSILIEMQDTLISIDYILGVSDERRNQNDAFEYYIGAKDHITANIAKNQIKELFQSIGSLSQDYNALNNKDSVNKTELTELLDQAIAFLDEAVTAFSNYHATLENSVASEYFSQNQIDNVKNTAMSYVKSAKSQLENMTNIRNSLINLETSDTAQLKIEENYVQKASALNSAEINLKKSENDLKNLRQSINLKKESAKLKLISAENDLRNLKSSLDIGQEDLSDILEGADKDDVAKARNEVALKELALTRAKDDSDKYEIIAAFDGSVRQIDYKVGDNILSDDDKFVYIENPDLLNIEILLDQIDIVKIAKGQKANIVFDALPEKIFTGLVDEVNQTPQESSGVVSYPVSISLNRGEEKIFSGMTAEVEVVISEINDILLVPNSAIRNLRNQKGVLRKNGNNSQIAIIETGETDGKNTQVINGLDPGDIVLEESLGTKLNTEQSAMPFGSSREGGEGFGPDKGTIMRTIR